MPILSRARNQVLALAAYAAAAVLYTWPLVRHLGSALTASPDGDGGLYVWNQWVFRHELVAHNRLPYFTNTIFGPNQGADLSLHNYTVFLDLLALPLIGPFGVVAAFNLVYLAVTVLTAYATYLLARDLSIEPRVAWLSGLLFAWSPVLVTRGMGHYSLVAAAPLPLCLLLVRRAYRRPRLGNAVALGLTIAWALTTDVYFAVYCVLIVGAYVVTQHVAVHAAAGRDRARRLLTVLAALAGAIVAAIAFSGGTAVELFGREIHARSLYTPVLILTVLVVARIACGLRLQMVRPTRDAVRTFVRLGSVTVLVATIVLTPFLYTIALRLAEGRFVMPEIFWRSSPRGVDLLALVLPNPNHPLAPAGEAAWLSSRQDGYLEAVASLPLTALLLCGMAWRLGWRPARWTLVMTGFFGLLTLGPFITVAGQLTYIPTPWALLRYVPIVELARTPARFAVVLTLFVALLAGGALSFLLPRVRRGGVLLAAAGVILAFELLPVPRQLYGAGIPSIYAHLRAAPSDVTVLELPFGIRDGTMSIGNFTSRTQFYQTAHERTVMGGYLSRISDARRRQFEADSISYALALLSEGRPIGDTARTALLVHGGAFIEANRIGFVVIDRRRTPAALRDLAIIAFALEPTARDGDLELYRPRAGGVPPLLAQEARRITER